MDEAVLGVVVDGREAILPLTIEGQAGVFEIDALLDTGCTTHLVLSQELIRVFDLKMAGVVDVMLADGSQVVCATYIAEVFWLGQRIPIEVTAAEITPLLGMPMLAGMQLRMDVIPDGVVSITRLDVSQTDH